MLIESDQIAVVVMLILIWHQFNHKLTVNNDNKQIYDRTWYLIDYLGQQAKLTNIKQKLLFGLITVNSNYGRSALFNGKYNINLDDEFFAESFARWILAPQNQRDWGWELENSFFLEPVWNLLNIIKLKKGIIISNLTVN
ncbi:MAG: hypothetical protein H9Q65_04375 [Spiroplasma ixodetis]|nr:hypothetical protein [Spiroplasma ixodetis]MBP1528459.1 hypothetical protein [Spiroplasma ixodetis]